MRGRPCQILTRPQGFTLLELLFVVGLLGFFALGASEVFSWALAIPHRTDRAASSLTQADTIVRHMRRDVWAADTIELPDSHTARLHIGGGPVIVWRLTDGHTVSRGGPEATGLEESGAERTWSGAGLPDGFAPSRTGLLLRVAAPDPSPVEARSGGSTGTTADKVLVPATHATRLLPLVSQIRMLNNPQGAP